MKYSKQDMLGKVVDIHTHSTGIAMYRMIQGKYPVSQDIVDLSETAKANAVDFMVTFPMPTTVYYDARKMRDDRVYVPSGVEEYPYQYENQSLVAMVRNLKLENMLPFLSFSLHDKIPQQLENIRQLAQQYNVYGLKYHGTLEQKGIRCPEFEEFAALAAQLNIPILLHSEISPVAHPLDALAFAREHPEVRLCVAHAANMFAPFYAQAQDAQLPNLFMDSAPLLRICDDPGAKSQCMPFDYEDPVSVLKSLHAALPNGLLWGTDMPWHRFFRKDGQLSTYSQEAALLQQSGLVDAISQNTCRFLFGE